jgi:hypothetical protein
MKNVFVAALGIMILLVAGSITCEQYCRSQSYIQCVGTLNISGSYPNCLCNFECTTVPIQNDSNSIKNNTGPKTCGLPCHVNLNKNYTAEELSCVTEEYMCTLEYRTGDACLKYLDCKMTGNTCKMEVSPSFYQCLSCYRDCVKTTNWTDAISQCDKKCAS